MDIKLELLKTGISDFIENNPEYFEIITDTVATDMLCEIQEIIKNNSYSDFDAIEKIVCVFEKYNIDFGCRHDF